MRIRRVKIHPAIGIARVGNSPNEYFIGPELPGDHSIPTGGYKDNYCRVKRQAARFRIFAYLEDGTFHELNSKAANITWTVHLANKKASVNERNPKVSLEDLIIDPGPRTLTGPHQSALFDSGKITFPGNPSVSVPLGEIRTDDLNHLEVLGGAGWSDSPFTTDLSLRDFYNNPGWYDDVSDGPVTATITVRKTGQQFVADRAWVIVAPPKFAPGIDSVITLYDRLMDMAVRAHWAVEPKIPSYTRDIFPILERAKKIKWVRNIFSPSAHSWAHPVTNLNLRSTIFSRLTKPEGGRAWPETMPDLTETPGPKFGRLTATQYQAMEKWKDGNYKNDWGVEPIADSDITPQGLDRAALESAVGGTLYPGIEAGGILEVGGISKIPILEEANYNGLFRFAESIEAGDITAYMALPWQADFKACNDTWWPVPRPNQVIPKGASTYSSWDRLVGTSVEMVKLWHKLGFVVQQRDDYLEVDRCPIGLIILVTHHVDFRDIPLMPFGLARSIAIPIVFEVRSIGEPVIFEIEFGPFHPRLNLLKQSVSVGPTTQNDIAIARIWLTYETGSPGETIYDHVVIRNPADGQNWNVTITANTIERRRTAVALVMDHSHGLSELDDEYRHKSLQQASKILVDTILEGDGLALVRFSDDVEILQPVEMLDAPTDPMQPARKKAKDILSRSILGNSQDTSVGNGIYGGCMALNSAGADYDIKSMIIFTTKEENFPRYIADVISQINVQTFSVGLGLPENTNIQKLQAVSSNHWGYMLVTDTLARNNEFRLQKYFLQIMASINNAEILLDTYGRLVIGKEQRIPFHLTESDRGLQVILLTRYQEKLNFRLQTPNGFIISPQNTRSTHIHISSDGFSYYRVVLPVETARGRLDSAGTWHVLVAASTPQKETKQELIAVEERNPDLDLEVISYNLLVQSYSDLSFKATILQNNFEVGSRVNLECNVLQSESPLTEGTFVRADLTRPDGTITSIAFEDKIAEEGRFTSGFNTTIAGIYQIRVTARGYSRLGYPFHRERSLTCATWHSAKFSKDPQQCS